MKGGIMNYTSEWQYEQARDSLHGKRFTCICGVSAWGTQMSEGSDGKRYCPEHVPPAVVEWKAPVFLLVSQAKPSLVSSRDRRQQFLPVSGKDRRVA